MNERIRELAEQADKWVADEYHLLFLNNVNPNRQELFNKKFAELLLKECLALNKSQLEVVPDKQEDWDGHNYGFTAAVCGFEDLVKEHFGVEL